MDGNYLSSKNVHSYNIPFNNMIQKYLEGAVYNGKITNSIKQQEDNHS